MPCFSSFLCMCCEEHFCGKHWSLADILEITKKGFSSCHKYKLFLYQSETCSAQGMNKYLWFTSP